MSQRLPEVNLLPDDEHDTSLAFSIFIGLVVVAIILYGLLGFYYFSINDKNNKAEKTYDSLEEEVTNVKEKISGRQTNEAVLLKDISVFLNQQDVHTSLFIREATDLLPDNNYMESFTYHDKEAEIVIHFETLDTIADYITDMNQSPFITDIRIDEVNKMDENPNEDGKASKDTFTEWKRYEGYLTIELNKEALEREEDIDE